MAGKCYENGTLSETAAQLFSRLGAKQLLDGLDQAFFKGLAAELCPGDSVELYGEEGCGKTEILLHFCANCILPKSNSSSRLYGKEVKVVFIDTSYKFPLWRLVHVLEQRIRNERKYTGDAVDAIEVEKLLKSCLQRLFLVHCTSSLNLVKSLSNMEKFFDENPDVSVLMIDSISEYYWTDRTIGGCGRYEQEALQRSIISKLKRFKDTYNLVIFVTKSAIMSKNLQTVQQANSMRKTDGIAKAPCDYLSLEWNNFLTHKYKVSRRFGCGIEKGEALYAATLTKQANPVECKFKITNSGIKFVTDE